jgi:two-component system, CAI-1 autoinducer sensor kinase/phosphatase CqsS
MSSTDQQPSLGSDPRWKGGRLFGPAAWLRRIWSRNAQSYIEFHAHAAFKIRFASIVGVLTFPFYYFLWTTFFPQAYENAWLRAVGTLLCLMLFLSPYWPKHLQRYAIAFSYITFVYSLPFFFTLMMLLNDVSPRWQLSLMASMIYLVFLVDTPNVIPAQILGSVCAVLAYLLMTGNAVPWQYWATLPIFAFSFIAMTLLNYSGDLIVKEKMRAVAALAAHIAHEMRTPLAAIRLDAEKATDYLPRLIDAHDFAVKNGWQGGALSPDQSARFEAALNRISRQATSANQVIDTLLVNVAVSEIPRDSFARHSMRMTIDAALDTYSFRTGQRERVQLASDSDFQFFGSDVLMRHVLFNLIRNALNAIEVVDGGAVTLTMRRGVHANVVAIADSGPGVANEQIQQLFVPFRSRTPDGTGTGVGLSFCKLVIEGFGGEIRYVSKPGESARFEISLPVIEGSAAVAAT